VTEHAVIDPAESRRGLWLRERRLRIALLLGLVESILVLFGGARWFVIVALAVAAVAFYVLVGKSARSHTVRELSWIAAASQLIAVLVPVLWEVVRVVAIVALLLMAAVLLLLLIADRR
jgi:hypothetical protein